MMRVLIVCSFVISAAGCSEKDSCTTDADCGDGFTCNVADNSCSSNVSVWDEVVDEFSSSLCSLTAACFGGDEASCEDDIVADMEDARALLEDAAENLCINCMKVKSKFSRIMEAAVVSATDSNVEESVSVIPARTGERATLRFRAASTVEFLTASWRSQHDFERLRPNDFQGGIYREFLLLSW